MGMFDEIAIANGILPEEFDGFYWQTKTFYCNLDWFTVNSDKKLCCTRGKFLGELDYSGIVEIHGYKKWSNPYHKIQPEDKFYSYLLDFEHGNLISFEENKEK